MRRGLALISFVGLSISLSAPGLSAASLPWASASDLCFGHTPTIVGVPAELVFGTEGPDVVVTNGAFGARTLGGDDLLCITGVAPVFDPPAFADTFDTGKGNDRVDATGGAFPYAVTILPGPGADEVLAGPHPLVTGELAGVSVSAADESASHLDADVIRTGDGPDTVDAGAHDTVHLGGDSDSLFVSDRGDLSGGDYDGGEGLNTVGLNLWPPFWHVKEHHSWKINNRAGRLTRDGEIVSQLTGFAIFDVQVRGPLRFVGSDVAEIVGSSSLPPEEPLGATEPRHHWPLMLAMGGGDDVIGYHRGGPDSRFDGGDGTDRFSFIVDRWNCFCPGDPEEGFLDLSVGTLRYGFSGAPEVRTTAVNFENVRWWSRADGTIIGTDGPNKLVTRLHKQGRDITMLGKGGDDILRGGLGQDVLIGGQGHDVADGQGGELDRCRAELRTHCET